jgi:outer membrane immunogenic protein
MKKLALAVSVLAISAVGASAADMAPVYTKAPAVVPAVVYDWTGFYVGGNAGGVWADPSVDVHTTNTFLNTPVLTALGLTTGPAAAVASTANIGVRSNGFIGGVQAGYNYQRGTWLAGVEADIQGIDSSTGSSTITQVAPRIGQPGDTVTATLGVSERLNYLGTVRGRIGFLPQPSVLLYATGGLAYGGVQSSTTISGGETPNTGITNFAGFGNLSSTRVGYTVGAGAEWKFAPQWSVKAEYLYYDLGNTSYSNGAMSGLLTPTTIVTFTNLSSSSIRFNGNIARVGVNYQFGGPVVAKY